MGSIQNLYIIARHCRQLCKDLKIDGGNGNKPKKPGSKKNKNKGPESGAVSKRKGKGKQPKSVPKRSKSNPSKKERVARKGKTSDPAPTNTDGPSAEPAGSKPKRRKATWACTGWGIWLE